MLPTCFGKGGGGSRVKPYALMLPTCLGRGGGGGFKSEPYALMLYLPHNCLH